MSKLFNICNIYIFLGCLYALQGIIYAQGIISQGILAVFLSISLYCVVKIHFQSDIPSLFKIMDILLIVSTLYGLIMMFDGQQYFIKESCEYYPKIEFLKNIYSSLLPIYTFYYFSKQGLISQKNICCWTIVFVIIATIVFWADHQAKLESALAMGWTNDEFTNNNGYVFLSFLPLLFFFNKHKTIQYGLLIYILVFILMSMKRGAILIGALALIWFVYRTFKASSKNSRIALLVIVSIALICISQYVIYLYETSDYFQLRLNNTLAGDSSGRNVIYKDLYTHFLYQTSNMQFLFGMGANGTLNVTYNLAHNDWLEIITNHGIMGLIVYTAFWIAIFATLYNTKQYDNIYSIFFMLVLIYFVMTFFSMSYNNIPMYSALAFGYCIAYVYHKPHNILNSNE